jgi:hypothetical protein
MIILACPHGHVVAVEADHPGLCAVCQREGHVCPLMKTGMKT